MINRRSRRPASPAWADEIGSIDLTMDRHLLEADLVIAEISTCNALYELGIRHALRPSTNITIAEDQITCPVHKRLWKVTGDQAAVETAVLACERGFDMRTDFYNGISLAFLLNERAAAAISPVEQITDFVNAQRVRRRVIPLCEAFLAAGSSAPADGYWAEGTLAEAHLGLGDEEASASWLVRAAEEPVADWMRQSTERRLEALRRLLEPSPLEMIPTR